LLDESDNTFRREREYVAALMGMLNDGYRRGGRTLLCLPPRWELTFLPVFAPKAIAGIGELPDTLASRSIRIELERRAPDETVARFRRRDAETEAAPIRDALAEWAAAQIDALKDARPVLPDELGDRAQDVWQPLIAIADAAGGDWPERARRAAITLSSACPPEDDSIGVRLLGDIRAVFASRGADRLPTSGLLDALHVLEEAPLGDGYGKPLSAHALAKQPKRFKVKPSNIRMPDGSTPKGYLRERFERAFPRYLPPENATAATTAQTSQNREVPNPQQDGAVADYDGGENPYGDGDVAAVAFSGPGTGGNDGPAGVHDTAADHTGNGPRRVCVRCGEVWQGAGTVCDARLDGAP